MTNTKKNLPTIPYFNLNEFKHYYITRDKVNEDKYHLYLFQYEPSYFKVNEKGYLEAYQKYNLLISHRLYSCIVGADKWSGGTVLYNTLQPYSEFAEMLLYNNIVIDLNKDNYEIKAMPEDGIVAQPELSFPAFPNRHNVQYKHYYILQDQNRLQTYHLYLFQYEPEYFKVNEKGYLEAYQKYDILLSYRQYSYTIGAEGWTGGTTTYNTLQLYNDFAERLTYNNIRIVPGEYIHEKNAVPEDGVIAALNPVFPVIPNRHNVQYKHYYILQDQSKLETYHLYLFQYEPVHFKINEKGYLEAYQKYNMLMIYRQYSYTVGAENWTGGTTTYNTLQLYNEFAERLIYNNIRIAPDKYVHEKNAVPEDGVIAALKPVFPVIPNRHNVQYKHYYILQDMNKLETYHLYLFQYKPAYFKINDKGYLEAYRSYNKLLSYYQYSYTVGSENWTGGTTTYSTLQLYHEFAERLIYNNMRIASQKYIHEKNDVPEDGVIAALDPVFPAIPNRHDTQYKHYCILQDQSRPEIYHLYLFQYEPMYFKINEKEHLEAYQKYNVLLTYRHYSYITGAENWTGGTTSYSIFRPYNEFVFALVYNNFGISINGDYRKEAPMPDDQVKPALKPVFPEVPEIGAADRSEYKYYLIMQDENVLEKYSLYLFKHKPAHFKYSLNGVISAYNFDDQYVAYRRYYYVAGQAGWTGGTTGYIALPFDSGTGFADRLIANNLPIEIDGYLTGVRCNPYIGDGINIGEPLNGWAKINERSYYYVNGTRYIGWLREERSRSGSMPCYYFNEKMSGAMVNNALKYVNGLLYCFLENGIMATGNQTMNGYEFSIHSNGVVAQKSPDQVYYKVNPEEIYAWEDLHSFQSLTPDGPLLPAALYRIKMNTTVKAVVPNKIDVSSSGTEWILLDFGKGETGWVLKNQLRPYNPDDDTSGDGIVNMSQMSAFGFSITASELKELNTFLENYELTDKNSIALFMATCGHESDKGAIMLEKGDEAYFNGNGYTGNTRGAGYMQITGEDHQKFYDEIEVKKPANSAKDIADNYPWLSAVWEWAKDAKGSGVIMNSYVKTNGSGENIFLITQYFVNSYLNKDDYPHFDSDLGSIRRGAEYTYDHEQKWVNADGKEFIGVLKINGRTYRLPKNYEDRLDNYREAIKHFK